MGGFYKVPRRIAMLGVALGVAFGIPNLAQAQAPPLQGERLPWQPGQVFTQPPRFGDSWSRVLSDLRAFADLHRYGGPRALSPAAQTDPAGALWGRDFRTYIPPSPEQPTIYVGNARARLMPVQVTPTIIAAESQTIQGVLVGLAIDLPDVL